MVKPICIIRAGEDAMVEVSGNKLSLYELQQLFESRLPDYHVFVIPAVNDPSEPQEYFTFQVFYEKDFTDIQYQELKNLIEQSIKNVKTTNP